MADDNEIKSQGNAAESTEIKAAEAPEQVKAETAGMETAKASDTVKAEPVKAESTKKKKSHKGLKITIAVVLGILAVCGGVFAYLYTTKKEFVQNKWAMITKDDTEYFRWVMDRNIAKLEEDFKEKAEKAKSTESVKVPGDWNSKGTLKVSLEPRLGSMFLGSNFIGIKDAGIKYELSSNKEKNLGVLATPFYKNIDLLTAGVQAESKDKKLYAALISYRPDAIDLSSFIEKKAEEKGIDSLDFESIIDVEAYKKKLDGFRGSLNEEKLDKLIHVVYDKADEASLEKNVNVTVNGLEAEVNVLSGKLDKDKCNKMIREYIDEIFNTLPALIPDINAAPLMSLTSNISADGPSTSFFAGSLGGSLGGDLGSTLSGLGLDLGSLGSSLSGLGLGGLGGSFGGGLINDLSKTAIDRALVKAKESILKKLDEFSISAEYSFYVDSNGDIIGGMVKLAANETKIKLDTLKLTDKENPDKAQCGLDISLNGLKLGSVLSNTEHKDGKKFFDVKIKLGSVIDMVLKGASKFEIAVTGSISDPDPNSNVLDFNLKITDPEGIAGELSLNNTFAGGSASMPLDTSEGNVVDIMELADTDYIDLEPMLRPVVGKLDEINDEGLNNFLSSFMKDRLGIEGLDVPGLKTMLDSGLVSAGNSIVKDKLKKALGIEPPYDYSSLSEKVKESEDGHYLYSWDIFAEAPSSAVYDNLSVKVYDHYQRLDEFKPDLETEKNKFLSEYLGQSFEREAGDDEGIEMGDRITFDVVPIIGSVPIDSFAYPGEKTTVGSYEYGEGIDDQLVGVKKGQTLDLTLTLDDRYGSFAGYTGVFRITVTDIIKVSIPDWNEEFIVGQLGYESVSALETALMDKANQDFEELYNQYAPTEAGLKAVLIDKVTEAIDVSCCGDEAKDSALKYQESLSATAGAELSDIYKAAGYSDEEILKLMGVDKSIPDYAVRRRIMDEIVVTAENLTVSSNSYDIFVNQLSSALGYADQNAFMEAAGNKYGQRFIVDMLIDREVTDLLFEKTVFDWN